MRKRSVINLLSALAVLCWMSAPSLAVQQSPSASPAGSESGATSNKTSDNKSEAIPSSPSVEDRLRALEQIIERQQREIESLREAVERKGNQTTLARSMENAERVSAADARTVASSEPVAQGEETQKKVDELYRKFGPIRLSGDIRFRMEPFANQGFDDPRDVPFRNRFRIRARLALDGQINKNFDWGLKLATGGFNDHITTNQTLTDFYERKTFALERAFVRYDSKGDKAGIQLIAGKFEPTFRRTQLVWDDDINVEGASEAVYFKTDSALKEIRILAFQLPFAEVSRGKDSVLYGGQAQTDWKLSPKVTANVNVAYYDWVRPDSVLAAFTPLTTTVNSGINNGAAITGGQNGPLGTTNRLIRDDDGNPTGFRANFHLFDILTNLTWQAKDRFPVTFTFDYVRNLSSRIDDEQNGYWAGAQVGQSRAKGDWLFGYTFARIEQDAVFVPFNFSDILASNSRSHIPTVGYTVANGVTLQWTGLFSQRVNRLFPLSPVNRTVNRMQFDVLYRF